MLRFFRINDPYRILFIFLILIGIRLIQNSFIEDQFLLELKWLLLGEWLGKGFQMYRETYDYTGPLAAMVFKFLDQFFSRSALTHHIFSSFLIIVQAGIYNRILLRNKAFDENNYLPAFFYVILALSVPDFMSLSPQLMSLTFILMALGSVLKRIDNQVTDELFLNSGLFIGVATLIYLPAFIFFFVFLFSLIVFSSAITRRLLLYLFGFLLVIGLSVTYFYWVGDFHYFVKSFFVSGLLMGRDELIGFWEISILSGPFAFIFILTVLRAFSSSRLTNFQKRVQQVIWFMFLGGIGCFFLTKKSAGLELIFLIPLMAYFLTHYFILLRNRIFKFIMPGLIVFGLLGFNLYAYTTLLDGLVVVEIPSEKENVLVLDENFAYYLNKEAGSPCFSRAICEEAFGGLDFYEPSTHIYKWLNKANPELIIDEIEVIPNVFHRFPLLEQKYEKDNAGNYQRISN